MKNSKISVNFNILNITKVELFNIKNINISVNISMSGQKKILSFFNNDDNNFFYKRFRDKFVHFTNFK